MQVERAQCPALDRSRRWFLYASGFFGAVAQLGERHVRNVEVSGSIPLGSTKVSATRGRAGVGHANPVPAVRRIWRQAENRHDPLAGIDFKNLSGPPRRTNPLLRRRNSRSKT